MDPTDYAADEFEMWEQALREQREVERKLEAARRRGPRRRVLELLPQVEALRTRADLLLADAVKLMCFFREESMLPGWVSSTQSQPLRDEAEDAFQAGASGAKP